LKRVKHWSNSVQHQTLVKRGPKRFKRWSNAGQMLIKPDKRVKNTGQTLLKRKHASGLHSQVQEQGTTILTPSGPSHRHGAKLDNAPFTTP
jgi:hypothetical protein